MASITNKACPTHAARDTLRARCLRRAPAKSPVHYAQASPVKAAWHGPGGS